MNTHHYALIDLRKYNNFIFIQFLLFLLSLIEKTIQPKHPPLTWQIRFDLHDLIMPFGLCHF